MTRFNGATTNHAGGTAFEPSTTQQALYKRVINNLLENTYYEDDVEALEAVRTAVDRCADVDPEYVLKLAAYARQEHGLRDIANALYVLAANDKRIYGAVTPEKFADYGVAALDRGDEPAKCIAIQSALYGPPSRSRRDPTEIGRPIPKPLRRGIEAKLNRMDEYEFAKYMGRSNAVSMYDVLNLVRPSAYDTEHDELFGRVARGDLDDHPEEKLTQDGSTWESVLSEQGNTAEAWRTILHDDEHGMPLFARIRNLRNMLEVGLEGEEIVGDITDDWLENSQLYPFRFYQAQKELERTGVSDRTVNRFLDHAIEVTTGNIPADLGNTAVGIDVSGSMSHALAEGSNLEMKEIAALFGAVLQQKGADAWVFAENTQFVEPKAGRETITDLVDSILNYYVGGSTNGFKVIKELTEESRQVDRIVMLTDCQLWDSTRFRQETTVKEALDEYREWIQPDASYYEIDLSSYGDLTMPSGYENCYQVSGWNSRVIEFILEAEREGEAIEEVAAYEPPRFARDDYQQ